VFVRWALPGLAGGATALPDPLPAFWRGRRGRRGGR